ncbi:MAG TPA: TIGR03790 family protein [Opitutales bacterium]|nr:TIGR03790 family protein [Opitutales bacterium]
MVRIFFQLLFLNLLFPLFLYPGIDVEELAKRVVIVVNERDSGSIKVGEHYAEKRNIPKKNIIRIDAPVSETITRTEFIETIRNPLQLKLLEEEWLSGFPTRLTDSEGRYRSAIDGHRISYLVLCRGVPLRIANDESRITEAMRNSVPDAHLAVNAASVDSELSLLTVLLPSFSMVVNPLFGNRNPPESDLNRVIKVARLDGPSVSDALALVDRAIEAEERGLRGRAYLDLAGPWQDGTDMLEATGVQIGALGFDTERREEKGTFPAAARFDAPALYFGWYANDVNGPFAVDGFRFPPGAIAFHIHSFSARTVRSKNRGWAGPMVARGAAVTFGNVYEPLLGASHRPNLVFEWLAAGGTVGDAAAYANPALSWQGVLIGDPLYRPFKRPLEEQLKDLGEGKADEWSGYALIRAMNLKIQAGEIEAAIEEGEAALEELESLPLALKVARLKADQRQRRGAVEVLGNLKWEPKGSGELMLGKEAADFLSSLGAHEAALRLYRVLLKMDPIPAELREPLLRDGLLLARRLNERRLADQWRTALQAVERGN